MKRLSSTLVGCLIAYLLLVGGVLTAQAVEHSHHHSHHQKETHATLLCSWICAAGQTVETDRVLIVGPVESLLRFEQCRPVIPQELHLIPPASRAPPPCI